MRSGSHDAQILEYDGEFVGVNLGWDFTAEHEWGIEDLTRDFGIVGTSRNKGLFGIGAKDTIGVEARQINDVPKGLTLTIKGNFTYLIYVRSWNDEYDITDETPKKELDHLVGAYGDRELVTAWDKKSFGVRVAGKEARIQLQILYNAFQEDNAMIAFLGSGGPFGNNGLCLFIISDLPDFMVDGYRDSDIDILNLTDAVEATGIKKRLEDAGCRYYALSPEWINDTKTELKFWLNPMDQHLYNSAWVTVEELDEWIAGKGKIMKEKA